MDGDKGGFEALTPVDIVGLEGAFERIASFQYSVIVKKDGYYLGDGDELTLAFDLRIATTGAWF